MIVAAVQHDVCWKDPDRTHDLVAPLIEQAVGAGARLVVLSEMFATGFSTEASDIVQPADGSSVTFLSDSAVRHRTWMAASVAVVDDSTGRPRNRFIAASPEGETIHYDKRHLFAYAGEHLEFEAGSESTSFVIDDVRVSPLVCYDLRFAPDFWGVGPETDLFVVVGNWPASRRKHWSTLLEARAIENQCYVIGVNRVGEADGLVYAGDSAIIDPQGHTLCSGSHQSMVLTADVDPQVVASTRERFPFLADRR